VSDRPLAQSEIRSELDRILASKQFAGAARMSRFFRYVVERTLAGEADQLKEFAVGVEVFDRDDKYDPRLDSIVRVEAGRLRSRLDEYYNGEGAASPIRISLPRGGYVAQFERRAEAPAPAPVAAPAVAEKRRTWAAWPLTAGLICAVAAMVVWLGGWNRTPARSGPAVAVIPFQQHSTSSEDALLAARLTENVATELARLGTVGVASHASAIQVSGERRPLREFGAMLGVDYVLEADMEREPPTGILIVLRIVNVATDRKVWVSDYRGAADDARGISQRIAFDVSTELLRRAR
jgi:TolB-like protein